MLIHYTKPNVLTIPISSLIEGRATEIDHIRLVPGVNEVAAEKWKKVAGQINIKKLVDSSVIEVLSNDDDTDEEFAISKAEIKDAVKIVKKTYDLVLLDTWKSAESRPGVLKAIQAQILEVEEKTKPRKKAANE